MSSETKAPFPWRAWPSLAWRATLVALSPFTCVFAVVATPAAAGRLCAAALLAADPGKHRSGARAISAGFLAIAHAGAACVAIAIGAMLGDRIEHEGLRLLAPSLLVMIASAAACAAWAPLALAPFALLDGEHGIVGALARSFELSARRGAGATARDGAIVGAIAGGVGIVSEVLGAFVDPARPIATLLWIVIAAPVIAIYLARAYVDARSRPSFDPAREPRVIAGVRNVLMLVVPAGAALVVALVLAALTPSSMREAAPELTASLTPYQASGPGGEVQLPGSHGLFVRARADGIEIGTADGGGAGPVQITDPFARPRGGMVIAHAAFEGRAAWVAVVDAPVWNDGRTIEHTFVTFFDDEGVRLDDGLGHRLSARVGSTSVGFVVFSLFLALVLAFRLSRTLEDARALDAPELGRDAPARGALSRVSGTLRLAEGARVTARGAAARVDGQARIELEGGAVVIALPPEVALLEIGDEALADGSEVTVVARFERLAPLGLRQGSMPWPGGARLVPTDRGHAAETVLDRASRVAAFFALGITVSLGLAATLVLMHL